jgi:hypothetical protein
MHNVLGFHTIGTIFPLISKDHDTKLESWNVKCEIQKCEKNENKNNGKKIA